MGKGQGHSPVGLTLTPLPNHPANSDLKHLRDTMTLQRLRDLLFLEVEGGRVSIDAHNGSSQLWWIPVVFVPKPAQQERAAASRKEILRPFSDHNEELVSSLR